MNSYLFHTFKKASHTMRYTGKSPAFKESTATHSFRVAALMIMACIETKERYGKEIDMEKAVVRAVFHDLCDTETGGFRYNTKQKLKTIVKKGERKINVELVNRLSASLRPYFYDMIVEAEDDSEEGKLLRAIDNFDAFLFIARESREGRRSPFFVEQHKLMLQKMRNHELEVIRYFTEEYEKKGDLYEFFMLLMEIDDEARWASSHNFLNDSVAEHSWRGAAEGTFFAVYENIKCKNGFQIDVLEVVCRFIFHDFAEAIAGDAKGTFKHKDEETREEFHGSEEEDAKDIIALLPAYYKPYMDRFMIQAKNKESYEGQLVSACDKVDALMKAHHERMINPFEYEVKYRNLLADVKKSYGEYPSVFYFLGMILTDLDDPNLNQ